MKNVCMKKQSILFGLLLCFATTSLAQPHYQPSEANLKARSEFQDSKLGVFPSLGVVQYVGYGRVDNDQQQPEL